jgi:hypothetical protein
MLAFTFVYGLTSFWEFVLLVCFLELPCGSLDYLVGKMDKSPP